MAKKVYRTRSKTQNKEIEYKKLVIENEERKLKESNLNAFIEMLKKGEVPFEWDEIIFSFKLKKAVVHKDESITFKFYSGYESIIKTERQCKYNKFCQNLFSKILKFVFRMCRIKLLVNNTLPLS